MPGRAGDGRDHAHRVALHQRAATGFADPHVARWLCL
jgi:hypothetical protein